jgi:glycosyltransferase involved in cell wall biosynthesis
VLAGHGVDAANRAILSRIPERLAPRFRLLGHRADVDAVFAGLDVAVSSSVSEAFPNAVGEAMASGVACVATAVGDTARLVGDAGLLVPPRDADALAAGIERLVRCSATRADLGARARRRIAAEFPIHEIAARYAAVYRELIPACAAS